MTISALTFARIFYPNVRLASRLFAFLIVYLFVVFTLADAAVTAHWPT
jgi:hypothetical protein